MRDNVAHAYKQGVAETIVSKTKEKYYSMFNEIKNELENNWID